MKSVLSIFTRHSANFAFTACFGTSKPTGRYFSYPYNYTAIAKNSIIEYQVIHPGNSEEPMTNKFIHHDRMMAQCNKMKLSMFGLDDICRLHNQRT